MTQAFGARILLTPRHFPLTFGCGECVREHPSILGVATVHAGFPLYFDAMNDKGLGMAGLNFPRSAVYHPRVAGKRNMASFELIPLVLATCADVGEASALLRECNVTSESAAATLPATPLHWIVADGERAITLESTRDGVQIYENPHGVLTNEPPFPEQLARMESVLALSPEPCTCEEGAPPLLAGGSMGLPGDYTSSARFARALFVKTHTVPGDTERDEVERFFHVMDSVCVPRGCVHTSQGEDHYTYYTSCASEKTGAYYFTTYNDRSVRCVCPEGERDGDTLVEYQMEE